MTQQQIKGQAGGLGSGGSLDVYDVPGSAIITPYSVSATFDGTGAAGAFLPCLTFVTQTGAVIARCPAPQIAAGASAEVSWFPHVAAPAATSSGLPACFVDTTTGFTLNPWGGIYSVVTWTLFNANDSSTFTWPGGSGATSVTIEQDGLYRFAYQYQVSTLNFPAGPDSILSTVSATSVHHTNETLSINATSGAAWRGDPSVGTPWGPIGERLFNAAPGTDVSLFMAWDGAAGSASIATVLGFMYRLGDRA